MGTPTENTTGSTPPTNAPGQAQPSGSTTDESKGKSPPGPPAAPAAPPPSGGSPRGGPKSTAPVPSVVFGVGAVGLAVCLALVVIAVVRHEVSPVQGAVWTLGVTSFLVVLLFLCHLGWILVGKFSAAMKDDGMPRFEQHWGGLGGNVRGWTISPAFGLLLCLAFVLAALVGVLSQVQHATGYFRDAQNTNSIVASVGTSTNEAKPAAKPIADSHEESAGKVSTNGLTVLSDTNHVPASSSKPHTGDK